MREYILPKWGWWVQIFSMLGMMAFSLAVILTSAIKHNNIAEYAVFLLFFLIPLFAIRYLWFHWPHKIVVTDDNHVFFYTQGGVTEMPVTDIHGVRFGRGIWLYHANGKFAFSAAPTNSTLFDFINEVSQRNPDFQVGSTYIRSRSRRKTGG